MESDKWLLDSLCFPHISGESWMRFLSEQRPQEESHPAMERDEEESETDLLLLPPLSVGVGELRLQLLLSLV